MRSVSKTYFCLKHLECPIGFINALYLRLASCPLYLINFLERRRDRNKRIGVLILLGHLKLEMFLTRSAKAYNVLFAV